MCQALLEIMEPEINKIKEKVKEETAREVTEQEKQRGIRNIIVALRVLGHENAEIKKAVMKVYHISESEAEEYL